VSLPAKGGVGQSCDYSSLAELLLSPFTQQDYDQVRECVHAIAPIELRGMKVVTRIELVAALLASACDHAYTSGEEDTKGDGPNLFALTEELVLRRAREIYAQGVTSRGLIANNGLLSFRRRPGYAPGCPRTPLCPKPRSPAPQRCQGPRGR
jgi:hypothetical protein